MKEISKPCFLFLLLVALAGCRRGSPEPSQPGFPEKAGERIELHREELGIEVRYLEYDPETGFLKFSRIEYKNGVTGLEYYRKDGTMREVEELYPLPENAELDTERSLKRTLLFEADGKSLLYQRSFRLDGTASMFGHRLSDGRYESEIYYDDGETVEVRLVSGSNEQIEEAEFYRENGIITTRYLVLPDGRRRVTKYRQDGSREFVTTSGRTPYDSVDREVYSVDGMTVTMRVKYTPYVVEVTYLTERGEVDQVRQYSSYGRTTVTVYENGRKKFRQYFNGQPSSDWTAPTGVSLHQVEEFDEQGDVVRVINFREDGKTPRTVTTPKPNYERYRMRHFREDGTLEKEELREQYNVTETEEFSVEDDVREELPEEFLAPMDEREKPPMLAQMPIAPPGCENCCGEGCEYCMD